MRTAICIVILGACAFSTVSIASDHPEPKRWMVGTELDLVPYLLSGWYASLVGGYGKWRLRYVRTRLTTPAFATESGFEDNRLDVNAFIVDYYVKRGFKGWWVGPGYEIWNGKVVQEVTGLEQTYRTQIVTLGGGYTIRFNDHVYLNPWAAVHIPVGGDTEVEFPGETFHIRATPELSIKVGFNF